MTVRSTSECSEFVCQSESLVTQPDVASSTPLKSRMYEKSIPVEMLLTNVDTPVGSISSPDIDVQLKDLTHNNLEG